MESQLKTELQKIKPLKVRDELTQKAATDDVLKLKSLRTKIVDYWKEPKKLAYDAHKSVTKKEKEMLDNVDIMITSIDSEIKSYLKEQDRIRREAEAKIREEAEAKAQAERKRLAEEARKKEEDAKVIADAAKKMAEGEEKKRLEEVALQKLIEAEKIEQEAEEVKAEPVENVIPISTITRTDSGKSVQGKDIKVDIVDPIAFFKWCADNGLAHLWQPKNGMIKKHIKDFKLNQVPGLNIDDDIKLTYGK